MDKHRKDRIYQRVQSEFGVNVFTRSYYCSGLSLENLKSKLKVKHGQECGIFVRFDHIVVKESESQIVVYLLLRHDNGKCAYFLHQGKVDCAFYFLLIAKVQQANSRIHVLFSLSDHKKWKRFFLFSSSFPLLFFFIEHVIIHLGYAKLDTNSF